MVTGLLRALDHYPAVGIAGIYSISCMALMQVISRYDPRDYFSGTNETDRTMETGC